MKTQGKFLVVVIAGCMLFNTCIGQVNTDSILACQAYRTLKRAGSLNAISVGFGVASNVEMAIIGGFPLEHNGGNPITNLSHAFLALGRVSFSVFPPIHVSKARKVLNPWRTSPEMAVSCKRLFAYLDAANILTTMAPVLSLGGGIMMAMASKQLVYNYDECTIKVKNPGLKSAGWVFVGLGLASSISGSVMIGLSKKELTKNMGSLSVHAGSSGIGMVYQLPESK